MVIMDVFPILSSLIWSALACISLPMNILALMVLSRSNKIEDVTKVFLKSLTISDIIMCVLYNIPAIGISATGNWPYGEVLCKIQALVLDPVSLSIYLLVLAINVERYIYIIHPLKYQRFCSVFRARFVVVITWIFVILLKSPAGIKTAFKHVAFDAKHQACILLPPESNNVHKIYAASIMALCFLPLVIVICLYGRILQVAKKSAKRFDKSSGHGSRTISPELRIKRNTKGATTCLLLTLSIIFSMLPVSIVFSLEYRDIKVNKYVVFICHIAFQCGGIFDVIIYYLRNRSLNDSVRQVFNSCKCRRS